jgi:AraC-like DNA-binding protein
MMKNFIPVDYTELIPSSVFIPPAPSEFAEHNVLDNHLGKVNVSYMALREFQVVKFDVDVQQNIHLRKCVDEETTVDTCVFLDGAVDSYFDGFEERMSMRKGMQNFLYQPSNVADHYVTSEQQLNIFHISVDRTYYTTLLCDDEKWSARLKENLLNKKPVKGSEENMPMSPQMYNIVNDILNCPLSGNLRSLVLEAKLIEFIALQLNHLVKEEHNRGAQKMKTSDKDALHALREFLHQTFTKDHSLKTLAMTFGLNEFKLKKGFKELFGTTVFDYLHDLKMEYAKQLLAAEDAFVSEVSGIVGYKNPNHFSTAFKRKFGINPTQLRR